MSRLEAPCKILLWDKVGRMVQGGECFIFLPEHLAGEGHLLTCNINGLPETVAWRSWFGSCSSAVCNFELFLWVATSLPLILCLCVSAKE